MVGVAGGDLFEMTVIRRWVLQVHLLRTNRHGFDSRVVFSVFLTTSMDSTHHLEGVGEGKVMVLGVGLMLSLSSSTADA